MSVIASEDVKRFDISTMSEEYYRLYEELHHINNSYFSKISTSLRKKRFAFFLLKLNSVQKPLKILDVGGTQIFWERMGYVYHKDIDIWLFNLNKESNTSKNFHSIVGDAKDMGCFGDKEFDVVFSNSVIEHVGDLNDQRKMASEIQRVGKRYFLQTPNRGFPIEPHFLFPLFHFLPQWFRVFLITHFKIGWYKKIADKKEAMKVVNSIRLLKRKEIKELFPGCSIHNEKMMGFNKSFVFYGGWEDTK